MNRSNGRKSQDESDVRMLPAYTLSEVSRYLVVPKATLRSWTLGRRYPLKGEATGFFKPLVRPAEEGLRLFSFVNLVEIHMLDALRRVHQIHMPQIRRALDYLETRLSSEHPLAMREMLTDGRELFINEYQRLVEISTAGQFAIREILDAYLRRIDRDTSGHALRVFPFVLKKSLPGSATSIEEPRWIVLDPQVAFGRPVLSGTGIPTAVIAERYKAGESIDDVARDYGQERAKIEEAIRCELLLDAA